MNNRKAALWRHRLCYRIGYLFTPLLLKKYSYTTDKLPKLSYPCLIMANHLTESDMLMLGSACPEPMDFVAGEHLMRTKFGPWIRYFFDPIFEFKGASTLATVKEIITRLKKGHSIAIFPEGSRSFNGETETLAPSIGKLVKLSGAGLVTYKIQGGYFIAPRWAYHFRKGPASGKIQHVLSPEELRGMSVAEITSLINSDLYENAYETQKKNPRPYRGEKLAEGLENYLIICPKCHSYDRMETSDNTFRCPVCGLHGTYTEEGFLEGPELPYRTVYDWGKWVEKTIREDLIQKQDGTDPLYTEDSVTLYTVADDHSRTDLVTGPMTVYKDRMVFPDREIFLADITFMNMLYFGKTLLFTAGKTRYGITGPAYHALKVSKLFELIKERPANQA